MTPDLRFRGFERGDAWTLRAVFDCSDGRGRDFTTYVALNREGELLDIQTSDAHVCGTTGRRETDAEIARRVRAELVRARSVAVVLEFDRDAQRRGRVA